jgi:hypothetical protein
MFLPCSLCTLVFFLVLLLQQPQFYDSHSKAITRPFDCGNLPLRPPFTELRHIVRPQSRGSRWSIAASTEGHGEVCKVVAAGAVRDKV